MQNITRITSFRRKQRQIRHFMMSLAVTLTVSAAICSCGGKNKRIEVTNGPSALQAHKAFMEKVSMTKETDIEKLTELAKEWHVLSDTLCHHIQPDSVGQKVYDLSVHNNLQDSILCLMERMVDAETRTFEDVLSVRERLGNQPIDTFLIHTCADARKFFESLDMAQLPQLTKEEAVSSYTTLLKNHLEKGIRSKADMQRFLRAEDLAFRGFLIHLHELGNTSLKNITSSTETLCELIFKSANNGQMKPETPLVFMFMRTNRRIIQNAMTCLADIKTGRITGDSEQAVVYLWMMMKPFFPMDELSLSLLSDKQKKDLHTLAVELPAVAAKLHKGMGWSPLPVEEMPNEIIKEIVCTR